MARKKKRWKSLEQEETKRTEKQEVVSRLHELYGEDASSCGLLVWKGSHQRSRHTIAMACLRA